MRAEGIYEIGTIRDPATDGRELRCTSCARRLPLSPYPNPAFSACEFRRSSLLKENKGDSPMVDLARLARSIILYIYAFL